MAFHRFVRAILDGGEIEIYGNGEQTRDFTFISDAVSGNMLAMTSNAEGEIFNIGGGSRVSINEVLDMIQSITESTVKIVYRDKQKGDVRHTLADTQKAKKHLGYMPEIDLKTGLKEEWKWFKEFWQAG